MTLGVLVNVGAVFFGGLIGERMGDRIPLSLKKSLPVIFGFCAMALGITKLFATQQLTVVILSIILGYICGEFLHLDERIAQQCERKVRWIIKSKEVDIELLLVVVILFCASGTGIFGTFQSVVNHDHSLLFSKSILDFFTAMIFSSILGKVVALIAFPQWIILLFISVVAYGVTGIFVGNVLNNFIATGALMTLIIGAKMSHMIDLKTANLLPSLLISVILTMIWQVYL